MNPILPKNYSDDFSKALLQPYNDYRESLPVVNYKNCYFTHSGIGLKGFKLIEETLFANLPKEHRRHFYKYALYKRFFSKKVHISGDNMLLLHNHWSTGYHHWITECLPKVLYIDASKYTLIIPDDYGQFAFDGLALFNFKEIKRVPLDMGVYTDNITLVASPNSGHYNPDLVKNIRNVLIEKCAGKVHIEPCNYVYISRKSAAHRMVENEEDVTNLLFRYGFRMIDMDKLNFYEQVTLFSQCKVLVSIHGAALTNSIFMPAGGKVLELYRSIKYANPWMNTCYWNLITANGLDYYYQFCEHGANFDSSADNTNIIVDIPKLEENIKMMMGEV